MRRNNTNISITIPQYANLKVYSTGIYLTVTLPISEEVANTVILSQSIDLFKKNNKYYITAKRGIPYPIKDIQSAVYQYAPAMLVELKRRIRRAKIAILSEEVKQLELWG
jgi:hypothetical protein